MTPPLAPGEKLSFSPTFFAPQAESLPGPSGCNRLFYGTLPGLHPGPYRVMVYHTRSTGVRQRIKPSASFASGGSPQPPLCKGGTDRRRRSGGIVKPGEWFSWCPWPGAAAPSGRGGSPPRSAPGSLPGDGLSHPEQKGRQRIKPSASFGSSVTLVGKLHSFGAGFFPSLRLARKGREGL